MLDRIDFVPDLPNGLRLMPMMLDVGRLVRTPQRRNRQYMFEGIEGIRMDVRRNAPLDLSSPMEELDPDPEDLNQYYINRVIINPWRFSNLYILQELFNRLFWRCRPERPDEPWPFRIQRVEVALDIPIEPELGLSGFVTTRGQAKHYQNQMDTQIKETVYGNAPSRLAIYDRCSALRRKGLPVPDHPLTRFERRFTKPSSWGGARYLPNREIQSIDWLINMCADIEDNVFQPFEGASIRQYNPIQTTPELNALRRQVLRAELRKAARTQALDNYIQRHAEFMAVATIAENYGYMDALQYIIDTYGRGHAEPYRSTVDNRCRAILNSMFPSTLDVDFNEALKASIRHHHFGGNAPRRINLPPVRSRIWLETHDH